jgi:putative membrane fusion protein
MIVKNLDQAAPVFEKGLQMGRKRVTGRFYVFLILVGIGLYFVIRELMPLGSSEAIVTMAATSYAQTVDAVVVRDEHVTAYEGSGLVVYVAAEGAEVVQGQEIADIYSAGYSEKEIRQLEVVRQNIRAYHRTILDNIVDRELERLEANVQQKALEVKTLIRKKTQGSLINLEKQLQSAMEARQSYLNQNQRQDQKLNSLYEEEAKRQNAIASWRTVESAAASGIVSFYLDGVEQFLTPENLESLTIDEIRSVLAGRAPQEVKTSRISQNIFRIVNPDRWYVALISRDATWNPVTGQVFTVQFEGFEGTIFSGKVVRMLKAGGEVMAQLEMETPIGPLINKRSGKAMIGINLSGLSVPVRAITVQSGQPGVTVSDAAGGTFVPVEVLSSDSQNAIVQPLVEGTLSIGWRVLMP